MRFFDSKEEVLDIELTQYGRRLLSRGSWKPEYYAFFDDNIIYDDKHAGGSGVKNQAETRIQDETPLLRTQYSFTGRDEYLYDGANDVEERSNMAVYEKLTVMPMSLGTSALDSIKTPTFKMLFLDGKMDNLEYNSTGALRTTNTGSHTGINHYSQQLLKIPQIESDIEFKISAVSQNNPEIRFEIDPALTPGTTYADGGQIVVGPSQILLLAEEENVPFDYKNFDIEVYEIVSGSTGPLGEEILNPLSFLKPVEMIKGNLMIDKREAELEAGRINGQTPELDPTFVEYYFNVNVDEEIDENLICKSITKLKSKNVLVDIDIECPELKNVISANIYASDADPECP